MQTLKASERFTPAICMPMSNGGTWHAKIDWEEPTTWGMTMCRFPALSPAHRQ
ncbi:hypothetical protein [Desulfocastanea catecholica]